MDNREKLLRNMYNDITRKSKARAKAKAEEKWENSVGPRWSGARQNHFSGIHSKVMSDIIDLRKKDNSSITSVFLYGVSGSGKSYWSYALVHEMILEGIITAEEYQILQEPSIANISMSGFEKEAKLSKILNKSLKVLVIDSVGVQQQYGYGDAKNAASREAMWFEITDFCYNNDVTLVITTSFGNESWLESYIGKPAFERFDSIKRSSLTFSDGSIRDKVKLMNSYQK